MDRHSPLKPAQALRLAMQLGDEVSFGRGRDCTVRTDGPGTHSYRTPLVKISNNFLRVDLRIRA
jgi:hypothetical protein